MAKNEDCATSDANTNAERKRHISISDSTAESEGTEIKWKRQNSPENNSVAKSNSIIRTNKSLDDLPPEMLEAVLRSLPSSDLLKCRQINQKCNEISSQIMRKRGDLQLYFSTATADGEFMRWMVRHRHCQEMLVNNICNSYEEASSKSLSDLIECLKEAKNFPITSFRFDDLNKFGNDDMESFLSIWGTSIVSLNVSIEDFQSDVGILRNLLVKRIPNLKELQINFGSERHPASTIELFADANEFQLPNLRVLRTNTYDSAYRPMIANILKAAPNLNNFYQYCNPERWAMFQGCVEDGITTDDLAMIQTLDKFHCLKDLRMELSENVIHSLALQRIDLKLESFAVSLQPSIYEKRQLKSSATAILNQIFHSSKDVIKWLRIEPLGTLGPDLNIPKMKNLRKLGLFGKSYRYRFPVEANDVALFSPPFQMDDNFPNLKELTLSDIDGDFFTFWTRQQLKPMPSIEILRIIGKLGSECEENLLKATPNITTLLIEDIGTYWNNSGQVSINFRLMANCLPKLKTLAWSFDRLTHHDLFHTLDAVITGLPVEFCEKISKKLRNSDSLSADELASYQLEQRNSSILDLKELKQFDVNFLLDEDLYTEIDMNEEWLECYCEGNCNDECGQFVKMDGESGFRPGDLLYKTGFSKVSKFLAFDLMPN